MDKEYWEKIDKVRILVKKRNEINQALHNMRHVNNEISIYPGRLYHYMSKEDYEDIIEMTMGSMEREINNIKDKIDIIIKELLDYSKV